MKKHHQQVVELTIQIPMPTYQALQAAAQCERRAGDLKEWIVTAAWRQAAEILRRRW